MFLATLANLVCRFSPQNVQGMAIDAARSNVEHHYNYIQDACSKFMRRYHAQVSSLGVQLPLLTCSLLSNRNCPSQPS